LAKYLGLDEWKWYALLSIASLLVGVIGVLLGNGTVAAAGGIVFLFSIFGVAYGLFKERPS
jgi:divalent metal cation (Fe/Co/Zn/Cd) transporter